MDEIIRNAILQSIQQNETVHLEHNDELDQELTVQCGDYDGDGLFWGETESGSEWQIRLVKAPR